MTVSNQNWLQVQRYQEIFCSLPARTKCRSREVSKKTKRQYLTTDISRVDCLFADKDMARQWRRAVSTPAISRFLTTSLLPFLSSFWAQYRRHLNLNCPRHLNCQNWRWQYHQYAVSGYLHSLSTFSSPVHRPAPASKQCKHNNTEVPVELCLNYHCISETAKNVSNDINCNARNSQYNTFAV